MPTAQIFREQLGGLLKFPEINYTKLNKEYKKEIISIFKLRTNSYSFQYDLHMRHYPVKNYLCKCGGNDTFRHIFECVYY